MLHDIQKREKNVSYMCADQNNYLKKIKQNVGAAYTIQWCQVVTIYFCPIIKLYMFCSNFESNHK